MNYVDDFKGYPIYLSDKPSKKYFVLVDGKRIYFGQYGFQHYFDKLGIYDKWNHLDKKRRRSFKLRHSLRRHFKGTPTWFSDQILW